MIEFTLKKIEEIEGKQDIFKMEIDGVCLFDEFENDIESKGQYEQELFSIYSLMEDVANNKLLPEPKFRDITNNKSDRIKEYEFKSKHLRVYAIKTKEGKVVVLGGYKNSQKKDIKRFRKIKANYKNTL